MHDAGKQGREGGCVHVLNWMLLCSCNIYIFWIDFILLDNVYTIKML